MRSVIVAIVCLVLAIGMMGCASGQPSGVPSAGQTATPVVAPTEVATTAAAPAATTAATTAATSVATTAAATAAPAGTTATGGGANTAGTLAQAGQTVYANSCAVCHGENGEGVSAPAVIGSGAGLAKYSTGQGLFDFTKKAMPLTAPGSLTDEQYLQVVAFMLVKNGDVQESAAMDQSSLAQIQLK